MPINIINTMPQAVQPPVGSNYESYDVKISYKTQQQAPQVLPQTQDSVSSWQPANISVHVHPTTAPAAASQTTVPMAQATQMPTVEIQRPQVVQNRQQNGQWSYEEIVEKERREVRMSQGVVPAQVTHKAAEEAPQQALRDRRFTVMDSWSPVVAFAITILFTGFMVSMAAPVVAPILFPTAVMIAAASLFAKAAFRE